MVLIPEYMEELEKLYNETLDSKDQKTFMFHGREMDVNYVKYLLEYMKGTQK